MGLALAVVGAGMALELGAFLVGGWALVSKEPRDGVLTACSRVVIIGAAIAFVGLALLVLHLTGVLS